MRKKIYFKDTYLVTKKRERGPTKNYFRNVMTLIPRCTISSYPKGAFWQDSPPPPPPPLPNYVQKETGYLKKKI